MNWSEFLFQNFSLTGVWGAIFTIYGMAWIILMIYYWVLFSRLAFYNDKTVKNNPEKSPPVSIVVAAKNEYANLKQFLPHILEQDYQKYEVIVVNDGSLDNSQELLEDLKRKYKHLKVINLYKNVNFFKGKKFPLSVGIRSAQYEHLLLTDADCSPAGDQWIKTMINHYDEKTEIVLGYGRYEIKPGLTNLLQRYDTILTAIQYFSFALSGMPYMGVGRNLSYLKTLFNRTKGFSSHYKIKSGDDDLFINKVANSNNTAICTNPEGSTISVGCGNFLRWVTQKRRHMTTARYYKLKHKIMLGLFNAARLLFWITLIALLIRYFNGLYVISSGLLMLFTFIFIQKKSMNKLGEKKILIISPVLDILLLFVYLFINFANLIRKPDKWK